MISAEPVQCCIQHLGRSSDGLPSDEAYLLRGQPSAQQSRKCGKPTILRLSSDELNLYTVIGKCSRDQLLAFTLRDVCGVIGQVELLGIEVVATDIHP